MKYRVVTISFSIGLASILLAFKYTKRYEQVEVCYRPGFQSCVPLLFAPPDDFPEVNFVPGAVGFLIGRIPILIGVTIFSNLGAYSRDIEGIDFYGPQRKVNTKHFGVVEIEWHADLSIPYMTVKLGSENRTYWVKMRGLK